MSDEDYLSPLTPEKLAEKLPEDTEWYTPKEVCALFRVDTRTLVRWEVGGKLEQYAVQVVRTLGNHRRYRKEDIDRLYYILNPKKEA